MRNNIFIKVRR